MRAMGPTRSSTEEPKYPMATLPPSPWSVIVLFTNVQAVKPIQYELVTLSTPTVRIDTAPGQQQTDTRHGRGSTQTNETRR
jgi:hypothetical protein